MKIFNAINEHAQPQTMEENDGKVANVCPECRNHYTNRGAGKLCPGCRIEDDRWTEEAWVA